MRACLVLLLALFVAGCETPGTGSIIGGECKVFERPQYVVLGKRRYDQNWIDGNIEAGVGGCGWKRPQARPATIDAPSRKAAPKAKPTLRARVKAIVHPAPAEIAPPVIEQPAESTVQPAPARDELLEPATSAAPSSPPRQHRRWCPAWLCGR